MIDPQNPDYTNTPVSSLRPVYGYAPADPHAVPAVSLVTPFFNPGVVFKETVQSVFRQSHQQWEWIVVDDCSDDPESVSILQDQAAKDLRIRILRTNSRGGPAAARNLGVNSARAEYVAFLDSDDLLEPTALEKWLWFLECHRQYAVVKGYQAGFGTEGYIWHQGFHSGAVMLDRNVIQTASMIRREVYLGVGGMDENIRGGMEDWDFWLRCANAGYWGGTIPEILDWYRRRVSHSDRWNDWDGDHRQSAFRQELINRYPRLFSEGIPQPEPSAPLPYAELPAACPFINKLRRDPEAHRILLLVPHLVLGGSDKFNLDLISQLTAKHSFKVTVVCTLPSAHEWRHRFEALTPDVFTLDTFLRLSDYPRFLTYLIRSRSIDSVLVTHSQMGYQLLPYIRAEFPEVRCFDYVHIEELSWKAGGYPAYSLSYRPFLDHTIASSQHLKTWMTDRGADVNKISVVTTNIDTEGWRRDRFAAAALQQKWNVPPGVPVILFAGWLSQRKRPNIVAMAVQALRDRNHQFLCLVAGDGEQGPWLRDFASQQQLSELRLLGNRTSEEIQELLAISDVFFLPSLHEGISLAIFEAMAMSTVVVAGDVGGQRELVTPDSGFLIGRGGNETEQYIEVLELLLTDPGRRQAMAERARMRVAEHFRLDEMGSRMAEILRARPSAKQFDFGQAFHAFASGFAREIIEQRRTEFVADRLWYERSLMSSASIETVKSSPSHPCQSAPVGGLNRYAALLWPLLGGKTHAHNRKLLLTVLSRADARRQLTKAFDRTFYCGSNPGVPSRGPLPLLHYLFYGYLEGKHPSPEFDAEAFSRTYPDETGSNTNPLLRKILITTQNGSGQRIEDT